MSNPISEYRLSLNKLYVSTFAIHREIIKTEAVENAPELTEGILLKEIVEYVLALGIYFMGCDGELTEEEEALFIEYVDATKCLNINVPIDNSFSWAENHLKKPPLFYLLALDDDKKSGCFTSSLVLWNLRNIICAIISVDGAITDEEIREAKLYLEFLQSIPNQLDIPWSYKVMDTSSIILEKLSCDYVEKSTNTEEYQNDLSNPLDELLGLVGLGQMKGEVGALINLLKVRKMRQERGLKMPEMSLHAVFSGNPGTGKTTVARLLGRIYKSLGVLSNGHIIEVDRSGLVAGYVGQTAIKTMDALKRAHGGILFIDEAYTLSGNRGNDYGQEAIDTILKYMEDNRDDIIVIVAGYGEEMTDFIGSNPGLQSRFNKFITFEDYSNDDLYSIFLQLAEKNHYYYNEETAQKIYSALALKKDTQPTAFANARSVRNFFESIIQRQADRIAKTYSDKDIDDCILHSISCEDIIP